MAAIVKSGLLSKRAQGKSRSRRNNWRDRHFTLSATALCYYQPVGSKPDGKLKGEIEIAKITAVENVPFETFGRPYMLQAVHSEAVLYIQCQTVKSRDEWVRALREQIKNHPQLNEKYHIGYYEGRWTCCSVMDRDLEGCTPAFDYRQIGRVVTSTRRASDPLPQPGANMPNASSPTPAQLPTTAPSGGDAVPPPRPPKSVPAPPPPQDKVLFTVTATHAFVNPEPTDLSFNEGDKLHVLEMTEDYWWKARDALGKVGMIPSNYIRRDGIESEKWFKKKLPRSEASALLRVEQHEGSFLVRESESKPGEYSLSVSHKHGVKHYHIKREDGKYFVTERHRFDTIMELVEYHKHNAGGIVTRLRRAVNDNSQPITAGLEHGRWQLDHRDIVLGKTLGSGQFGVVKMGVYKQTRNVAVKMMKEGTMSEEDFVAEAQVMTKFKHKNLVELHGVCTTIRPVYIVTELMSNGCLLDHLREKKQHFEGHPEILHYMSVQVCSAMCFLEDHGFIHRDLAARNCLVGDHNIVKVADFGLARMTLDDEYTASEGTKFPIKWAAPEVFQFARFSTKSDVWSFGVLLWEIWTLGVTPYPSMTNTEVVQALERDNYRMECPSNANDAVYSIMKQCWHTDPEGRPSFNDVSQMLDENKTDYADDI